MVPRVPLSTSARCAFAAAWLALLGVAGPVPADSPGAGAAASEASKPVAEVDGKPITMGELEKSVASQLAKLDHQRRAVLERGLGSLIDQKILQAEAASRGMTVEALEKAGILVETTGKKRDRWWVYQRYLDKLRVGTEL